jgi:hypothetical protein
MQAGRDTFRYPPAKDFQGLVVEVTQIATAPSVQLGSRMDRPQKAGLRSVRSYAKAGPPCSVRPCRDPHSRQPPGAQLQRAAPCTILATRF